MTWPMTFVPAGSDGRFVTDTFPALSTITCPITFVPAASGPPMAT